MKHHDLDHGVISRMARGGAVADGDYGDIIVSGSGATWTLDTVSDLYIASGGSIDWNGGDVTITHSASNFIYVSGGVFGIYYNPGTTGYVMQVSQNYDSANVNVASFRGAGRAVAANGDEAYLSFGLENSAGSQVVVGRLVWQMDTVTSLAEDGRFELYNLDNGSDTRTHVFARDYTYFNHCTLYFNQYGNIAFPIEIRDVNYNEVAEFLGVASAVNNVHFTSAATGSGPIIAAVGDDTNIHLQIQGKGTGNVQVINSTFEVVDGVISLGDPYFYDNGTEIVFAPNAAGGDVYDMGATNFMPTTSDGAALGSATQMWSDAYFASGGTINFDNGNAVIEHGSNRLYTKSASLQAQYSSTTTAPLRSYNNVDNATVPLARFEGDRATPATGDAGYVDYVLSNAAGTQTVFTQFGVYALDGTAATEDGLSYFNVMRGGVSTRALDIDSSYIGVGGDTLWFRGYGAIANNNYLRDANYNEILTMDPVASAVNNISITNAATGNSPVLSAIGDDTDVSLHIRIKGAGEGQLENASGTPAAGWGSGYFYMNQQVIHGGIVEPAALSANQNDYSPAGLSTASVLKLDVTTDIDITGIAGGYEGRVLIIQNTDTANNFITLTNEDALSAAANRIITPDNFNCVLRNGINAILMYDGVAQRWRVLARPASRGDQADMESNSSVSAFVTANYTEFAPSAAKCWVAGTTNSTVILASYNITSLGDTATGQQTVTIASDFSSANYCVQVTVDDSSTTLVKSATVTGRAAGSYVMNSVVEAGSGSDPAAAWHSVAYGDR